MKRAQINLWALRTITSGVPKKANPCVEIISHRGSTRASRFESISTQGSLSSTQINRIDSTSTLLQARIRNYATDSNAQSSAKNCELLNPTSGACQ